MRSGTRVQTQVNPDYNTEYTNKDPSWYCGTVDCAYESGRAKVVYDGGDWEWVELAVYIYALPPEHPAYDCHTDGSGFLMRDGLTDMDVTGKAGMEVPLEKVRELQRQCARAKEQTSMPVANATAMPIPFVTAAAMP